MVDPIIAITVFIFLKYAVICIISLYAAIFVVCIFGACFQLLFTNNATIFLIVTFINCCFSKVVPKVCHNLIKKTSGMLLVQIRLLDLP